VGTGCRHRRGKSRFEAGSRFWNRGALKRDLATPLNPARLLFTSRPLLGFPFGASAASSEHVRCSAHSPSSSAARINAPAPIGGG
jgi:hypothetical protein